MSTETSIPGGRPFPSLRELTGTVIDGRYEIGPLLGCGGMGAVYEAMQLRLDRRVAIKILNPVYMHRDDYVTRFMREAKAASRIRHENVVQVLDFGELPEGSVYSVMEFLEGRDLAQVLQDEIRLPWPRSRDLLLQMARGLKAAHAEGVIHRDIKPANLFLVPVADEEREVLKILDFGIARLQTQANSGLTGTAELLGTPSYMAPELARGRSANPRSEVYSVGVVAYRLLTGQLPFEGQTAFDVLFRSATEPAPPLRNHDPSIPEAIEALVLRMLAKDPEDRFPDMPTLLRAIDAVDENGRLGTSRITTTGPHAPLETSSERRFVGRPPQLGRPGEAIPRSADASSQRMDMRDGPTADDFGGNTDPIGAEDRLAAPTTVFAIERSGPVRTETPSGRVVPQLLDPATPMPVTASLGPAAEREPSSGSMPQLQPLSETTAPQVVVPPPLMVSDSTRAAIAATRAARSGTSSSSMRLGDQPSGPEPVLQPWPLDVPPPGDEPHGDITTVKRVVKSGEHDFVDLDSIGYTRHRRQKLILGGIAGAVVLFVGILAVALSGGDDPPDAAKKAAAPTVIGSPTVPPDKQPSPSPTPAPVGDRATDPEPTVTPTPAPPEPAPEEDEPVIVDPEPEPEPPRPTPKPASEPKTASKPKPTSPKPTAPKPEPAPAAEEPLDDAAVLAKLERKLERKCGKLAGGAKLTVTFAIGANGKIFTPRANLGGDAGKCAVGVVTGATFAPGGMRKKEIST